MVETVDFIYDDDRVCQDGQHAHRAVGVLHERKELIDCRQRVALSKSRANILASTSYCFFWRSSGLLGFSSGVSNIPSSSYSAVPCMRGIVFGREGHIIAKAFGRGGSRRVEEKPAPQDAHGVEKRSSAMRPAFYLNRRVQ